METMPTVNIMTVGKTGVGKSTLINSVFREKLAETGVGSPVTRHLRRYNKETIPISIYDTKGLELKEEVHLNPFMTKCIIRMDSDTKNLLALCRC